MKNKQKSKKKRWITALAIAAGLIAAVAVFLVVRSIVNSGKAAKDTSKMEEIMNGAGSFDRPGLYVDGTALKTKDGTEVVMRGVNHPHSWYKNFDDTAFKAIAETGSNAIRIVCACGIRWDKDSAETLKALINKAKEHGMLAIVEVHDGTGKDEITVLEQIAEYWVSMADVLKGTEEYCILNIANEWCGKYSAGLWRDGYVKVIPMLRKAGIRNVLMVDAAGWGQFGGSIRKYGVEVFEADECRNTMFSVHMYGNAGGSSVKVKENLTAATASGLCVCVGEFGWKHSDGNVDEDFIMKYCTEEDIGYLAWSWKGNSGGVEYLDLTDKWDGSALTKEWGEKVVNGEYGIKATSKRYIEPSK
ncbi:MAG: cellulase family glycosylhydrolase [Lachnospiraceae bacterium]|nr:cellulase family glycosylhydrolase [Lachnospiraceae bacterium]